MILGDIITKPIVLLKGTQIIDAAAGIRDVVAYAELTQRAICILSLDIRTAFDNVLQEYLYHIFKEHGFDDTSTHILRFLYSYKNVTSRCEVNVLISGRFAI
jgi:hypothetical protein